MRWSLEVKVGTFVLITLSILFAFVFALGDINWSHGITFYVDYAYSGGVQTGAPVKVSGIKIGHISSVTYIGSEPDLSPPAATGNPKPIVRLKVFVEEQFEPAINQATRFFVTRAGMFGEPYIEIKNDETAPAITDGLSIRGEDYPRLDLLMSKLSDFSNNLSLPSGVKWGDVAIFLKNSADFLGTMSNVLTKNQNSVESIVASAKRSMDNIERSTLQINAMFNEGGMAYQSVENTQNITKTVEQELHLVLNDTKKALSTIVQAGEIIKAFPPKKIHNIIDKAQTTANHLELAAKDIHEITYQTRQGQGTIGAFLANPLLYNEVRDLVADLRRNPWKVLWRQ